MEPGLGGQILPRKVRQPPDPEDFERTLRFVEHVMDLSRDFMMNENQVELHGSENR